MGRDGHLLGLTPQARERGILKNKLIKKIQQHGEGSLVLLGDFNSVMEENKDKSDKVSSHSGIPNVFLKWLLNQQMVDIWRDNFFKK